MSSGNSASAGAPPVARPLPMVSVDRVSRLFGEAQAVVDASFHVDAGRFLTILGPSGSGKTTLLRMIAGFIAPTRGEIFIHGQPVSAVPPHRRSIGMVFQRLALFPHLDAWDNVAYPLRMRRFDAREIPDRVARMFRIVQLPGLEKRRIHELSGGQQQRVAIARALVFEPDLVLLDEPLAALDRKLREEMQLEFRRIQQELGVTTINVTHDQREALVMSDDVVVMEQGRIQQFAPPGETYRQPANAFVAGFIGVTNLWSGRGAGASAGGIEVRIGGHVVSGVCADGVASADGEVQCALRAEHVRIVPAGSNPEGEQAVDGVVARTVFEGDRIVYEVDVPSLGPVPVRAIDRAPDEHGAFRPGDAVRLGWRTRDVRVFPKSPTLHRAQEQEQT